MLLNTSARDPVRLLEALYALDQPSENWFRGVLDRAGEVLDKGHGVGMLLYDISGTVPRVQALAGANIDPQNVAVGEASHDVPEWAEGIIECYRTQVCGTLDEHVPQAEVRCGLRERYAKLGIRDQISINGANHSGFGCALYVFSGELLQLSELERTLLRRVAFHLGAAYRLHQRLHPVHPASTPDAVLRVDGRLEHAEASASSEQARRSLVEGVKQREWARTRVARRDAEQATRAWKPMLRGTWSLVDSYERDGTRFITARENICEPKGLEALSPRERQVASLASLGSMVRDFSTEIQVPARSASRPTPRRRLAEPDG